MTTSDNIIPHWAKWGFLPAMVLIFVVFRSFTLVPHVFPEDGSVRLTGADPYFHVRHAEYSAKHFPDILRVDPGSHYPGLVYVNETGLYNLGVATLSFVFRPFYSPSRSVRLAAAVSPVLLGVLTLILLFFLGARIGGGLGAVLVCVFWLSFPGSSLDRTELGFADQHAAEIFLAIAACLGLVGAMQDRAKASINWGLMVGGSLALAALFYTWLGAPVFLFYFSCAIFAVIMIASWTEQESGLGKRFLIYFGIVALVQIFVLLFVPKLIMEFGQNVRFWNLAGFLGLACLPLLYVRGLSEIKSRTGISHRLIVSVTIVVGLAFSWYFFTQTGTGRYFWGQLTYPRSGTIAEQKNITFADFWSSFELLAVLALVSIPLTLFSRNSRQLERVFLLTIGSLITWVWVVTNDFDYTPPAFLAIMATIGVVQIVASWTPDVKPGSRIRLYVTIGAVSSLVMLWSLSSSQRPWITRTQAYQHVMFGDAWLESMLFLRTKTPPSSVTPISRIGTASDYLAGSYGVISAWDYGNVIADVGKRLPVMSRYPSSLDGQWSTSTSEEEALSLLCGGCSGNQHIRYALVTGQMASDFFSNRSIARTDSAHALALGYWQVGETRIPHLTFGAPFDDAHVTRLYRDGGTGYKHHRLVFESSQKRLSYYQYEPTLEAINRASVPIGPNMSLEEAEQITEGQFTKVGPFFVYDAFLEPDIKIFELVRGATLTGSASPRDTVSIQLVLKNLTSDRFSVYRQGTVAGNDGSFALTVPYHTLQSDPHSDVVATNTYFWGSSSHPTVFEQIAVSPENVSRGDTLRINQF